MKHLQSNLQCMSFTEINSQTGHSCRFAIILACAVCVDMNESVAILHEIIFAETCHFHDVLGECSRLFFIDFGLFRWHGSTGDFACWSFRCGRQLCQATWLFKNVSFSIENIGMDESWPLTNNIALLPRFRTNSSASSLVLNFLNTGAVNPFTWASHSGLKRRMGRWKWVQIVWTLNGLTMLWIRRWFGRGPRHRKAYPSMISSSNAKIP